MGHDPEEVRLLRESLQACREELARVREDQEGILEAAATERALRAEIERQSRRLAEVVEEGLLRLPEGAGLWARARRRIKRSRLASAEEWRASEMVARSELFSAAWYIRRYPDVVSKGLPPALHYVRHGAADGKDPSEQFNTRRYLKAHPELAETGENPLVHHLRSEQRTDRVL